MTPIRLISNLFTESVGFIAAALLAGFAVFTLAGVKKKPLPILLGCVATLALIYGLSWLENAGGVLLMLILAAALLKYREGWDRFMNMKLLSKIGNLIVYIMASIVLSTAVGLLATFIVSLSP